MAILVDPSKCALLQVELADEIDVGKHFVKATYSLKGDGPLVFTCFEVVSTVNASIHAAHLPNTDGFPNTDSVPNTEAVICLKLLAAHQWLSYAKQCLELGLNYFRIN